MKLTVFVQEQQKGAKMKKIWKKKNLKNGYKSLRDIRFI